MTLIIEGVGDFEEIAGEVKISDVSNHIEDDDFEVNNK